MYRMNLLKYGVTPSPHFTPLYPFETAANIYQLAGDRHVLNNAPGIWQSSSSVFDSVELAWQRYFIDHTPNGSLIRNNSLFEALRTGEKDYLLLHITPSYELIRESGLLYPSGGSLGSTVYCVPAHDDGTVHNLINFILNYEIPQSHKVRGITGKRPQVLAISVAAESYRRANMELAGLDHLLLGTLQSEIYEDFLREADVKPAQQHALEENICSRIRDNIAFLNLCTEYDLEALPAVSFFELFSNLLRTSPFFGYLYFEVLVEYVALFQDDAATKALRGYGEFNNHNHKKMIFEVATHLLSSFKLIEFNSPVLLFADYLQSKSDQGICIPHFEREHFLNFMKWRIAQVIRYKIMQRTPITDRDSFQDLCQSHPSLIGQMIRTEIALSQELKSIAYVYDILRADAIRLFWNKNNILFPYNAIIPKGEVGINPSFKGLDYRIYEASIDKAHNKVRLEKETGIRLAEELINPALSTLRFQQVKV